MLDAGAEWAFSSTSPPIGDIDPGREHPLGLAPASKHVMGTCRMGDDPATSVVGPDGRFHDIENLSVRRLLGVRDLCRLQPDADHRGPRPPDRLPALWRVDSRDTTFHSLNLGPIPAD